MYDQSDIDATNIETDHGDFVLIGDGLCACFDVKNTSITTHCHRSCGECEYAGVHYKDDKNIELAQKIADYLHESYRADFELRKN